MWTKENAANAAKRRRARLKAKGRCTRCGGPRKRGYVTCQSCIDVAKAFQMSKYGQSEATA